jgi:hypothetical protein
MFVVFCIRVQENGHKHNAKDKDYAKAFFRQGSTSNLYWTYLLQTLLIFRPVFGISWG